MLLVNLLAALSFLVPQDSLRWDFEADAPGAVPGGWFIPPTIALGYGAEVVEDDPHGGRRCVRIYSATKGKLPSAT